MISLVYATVCSEKSILNLPPTPIRDKGLSHVTVAHIARSPIGRSGRSGVCYLGRYISDKKANGDY